MDSTAIELLLAAWKPYLATVSDWQKLVKGIRPKEGGCGLVYELPNPIDRPNESFAIADMRELDISEPHKHINGETEIYFVLQGTGKIAVGREFYDLAPGIAVVTPPDTVHCTLPRKDLVIAVVNTPPFDPHNYVTANEDERPIAEMIVKLNV